ncbi:DsbA family protein [Armatimonas rosea]|uniref:Protein-disulfide isomerase n=1 Tax=Armatimonas rosea TaxID=685828 RepID=A0A7W9ST32_ARMRO|nr:thioredoxin domain-containing protein [Armatimonas rosea]MBB6052347.1 protein-disulfide isomerase [Armatimonas rosea]
MNLDEKTQAWHADARLSPAVRTRLSQRPPEAPRRPVPLVVRYSLAAVVGIGLGVGFVNRHRLGTTTTSRITEQQSADLPRDFKAIQALLTPVTAPKDARYDVILFTDFECPSCKVAHSQVRKLPQIRLSICPFPLVTIHPDAFRFAWIMELAIAQGRFSSTADAFERDFDTLKTLSDADICKRLKLNMTNYNEEHMAAFRRVQTQWDGAKAHGIKQTPTFWVRDLQTGDVREATGIKNFQALVSGVQK